MKYANWVTVFALILTGCVKKNETAKVIAHQNIVEVTDAQYKAAAIEVGQVQNVLLGRRLQVTGVLGVPPQNLVTISAPMGGFVKSTKLLLGTKVRKGEALVTLENPEYILLQQDYLENLSRLEFFLDEYQRQQTLSQENINSQKALQQAKSQYESTLANVKGLEARLSMINIKSSSIQNGMIRPVIHLYSPIDGFVTEVNVNTGQFVNGTDPIFKIVNLDHIHVELQVYEKDVRDLKIGQKVTFQLVNDQQPKTASVYLIGKQISAERTVSVHCHLSEEDPSLLPGMFVTATVETENAMANVVPADAVVNLSGENFVFVFSGEHQYKAVKVQTGRETGIYTEIIPIEGKLEVGTPVVVHGAFQLLGLLKSTPE